MGDLGDPQSMPTDSGSPPEPVGAMGDDVARVANAATELGLSVPRDLHLLGVDEDGHHIAAVHGGPTAMRTAAAILHRLDGPPVAECLASMERAAEPTPEPAWSPPAGLSDNDALLAYLAELKRHPEWPRIYNSATDWIALVGGIGALAGATATVLNLRTRRAFAQYVVDQAVRQGAQIDPVALIRAFEGSQPQGAMETSDRADEDSADPPRGEPTGSP